MPSEERVQFLSVDEVVAIHDRLVTTFGGPPGIRDRGLLESALFRPQTSYYSDLTQMAAALFESLLMNHPFVDGNKRVLIGLPEAKQSDYDHLLPWIRQSLVPLSSTA